MKTITIKLTAPLQSYGDEANFDRRTTGRYPSKSAIIGMIAATLGYQRNDSRIIDLNKLAFAVRVDQPGTILRDFQIVEWNPSKEERKLTYCDYLQDAVFVVAIGSDDIDLIAEIKSALTHPKYQLFLGRRANVPAGRLHIREFDENPVIALETQEWAAASWYQKRKQQKSMVEVDLFADANLLNADPARIQMIKDQVVSFDPRNRQHGFRALASERILLTNPLYKDVDATDHDAMSVL